LIRMSSGSLILPSASRYVPAHDVHVHILSADLNG
jgi:hypothetical protein